ncbi:MotE family protein [Aquifex aeolicus]|uniref:Uncharacterized protein aq_1680 n=1 Tax=Aquifex aeolicus (strain VF5) TaxID=224324 RepID=Y1680_AQUAE|nr:MotE family protein [Aquifex aeolicus]O67591.1 RecName: Full=Uncharacterized protein aq_1680 [Aquifex aeolicus VF5]AAC07555.1 putative protein [Aquifex aeolicus VF5]
MFKRIREIKEKEQEELVRKISELLALERELERKLEELLREYDRKSQSVNTLNEIFKLKAITRKIEETVDYLEELNVKKEELKEKYLELKGEIKSIEILEERKKREKIKKEIAVSLQELGFMHLVKKIIPVFFMFFSFLFSESATQKALKDSINLKEDYKVLLKLIEEKLKKLEEERKKLEALQKTPLTEEEKKKLEKLIKSVEKAPADEIAPAIENLPPKLAAEILLRIKERKAGQILANMNPQKASEIMKYILERNPSFNAQVD